MQKKITVTKMLDMYGSQFRFGKPVSGFHNSEMLLYL